MSFKRVLIEVLSLNFLSPYKSLKIQRFLYTRTLTTPPHPLVSWRWSESVCVSILFNLVEFGFERKRDRREEEFGRAGNGGVRNIG